MRTLRLGICFETFGTYARRAGDPVDFEAEYEPEETVRVLEAAVRQLGHTPVRLGGPLELLARIGKAELPVLDAALNIAEGRGSRNREAWAPALLEMAGVPTLGSDGLTLSLSLDKAVAHRLVAAAGVQVPAHRVVDSPAEAARFALPSPFPLFVKPRWEGTAKGVRATSRVEDRAGLVAEVARITADYQQPALVERFLSGPEYTVAVVGNQPARALPVLQRALEAKTGIGLHALEGPGGALPGAVLSHRLPGDLSPELEAELQRLAIAAYDALECLDFARVDFRLDAAARPYFLEINPLPTFAPDGSFGILAELEGRLLPELLADVFGAGLARLGLGAAGSQPTRSQPVGTQPVGSEP